ncbi:GntR family transcriptional regulator [bacterium]|nr:GntR family transcriptional regulator [bacterium]
MKPEFTMDKSIYLQIAESIEDDILQQVVEEESQVPSTNQMAVLYRINPATAAKGINLLVSEGIIYKKRGIGMFVSTGAVKKIRSKRKTAFFDNFIVPMMAEATNLEISREEVAELIKGAGEKIR